MQSPFRFNEAIKAKGINVSSLSLQRFNLIPRPVEDIILGYIQLRNRKDQEFIEEEILFISEQMIKAALRVTSIAVALPALSMAALLPVIYEVDPSILAKSLAVGSVLSFPCVMIAGGSWLLYDGTAQVVASFATGSFAALGLSFAYLVGGWVTLQNHDYISLGLAEYYFGKIANNHASSLAAKIIK